MTRRLTLAAFAAALVIVAAGGCSFRHRTKEVKTLSPSEARDVLVNRNWMDRMPEHAQDHLFVYRFVPSMGGGVFQDRTVFKGTFELFTFETQDGWLVFTFPDTDQHWSTWYSIDEIDEPPFDLKLTLEHSPRGPAVYYGMRSESGAADLDAMLAAHAAR